MPRQKTAERKPAVEEPAEEYVPSWQRDSVDRSLRNAIDRARKRSDRFVDAAVELLSERDEGDFSIQDVVDRSSQSQRTFYTFFDSKDSLMLAVYETILRKTAMPMLQARCEGIDDPVLRLQGSTGRIVGDHRDAGAAGAGVECSSLAARRDAAKRPRRGGWSPCTPSSSNC